MAEGLFKIVHSLNFPETLAFFLRNYMLFVNSQPIANYFPVCLAWQITVMAFLVACGWLRWHWCWYSELLLGPGDPGRDLCHSAIRSAPKPAQDVGYNCPFLFKSLSSNPVSCLSIGSLRCRWPYWMKKYAWSNLNCFTCWFSPSNWCSLAPALSMVFGSELTGRRVPNNKVSSWADCWWEKRQKQKLEPEVLHRLMTCGKQVY